MTQQWFIHQNGRQDGPFSPEQIKEKAQNGTVAPTDFLWAQGQADWVQAGTFPSLFPDISFVPNAVTANYPIGGGNARAVPNDIADMPGMEWVIPVKTSLWAIAAGYAGLFAISIVLAPIALILGIIALIHIKKHPGLHGLGRAVFAVISGGLFSVPLAVMLFSIVFSMVFG